MAVTAMADAVSRYQILISNLVCSKLSSVLTFAAPFLKTHLKPSAPSPLSLSPEDCMWPVTQHSPFPAVGEQATSGVPGGAQGSQTALN